MKNRKSIKIRPWAMLIFVLLLIGCTQDEESTAESLKPLPLSIASASTNVDNGPATKGDLTTINEGSIGVFNSVDPIAGVAASTIIKYTVNSGTWVPEGSFLSIASTTNIGAYYPYSGVYTNPTQISIETVLDNKESYTNNFVYYELPSTATKVGNKYEKSFSLTPAHAIIKFKLSGTADANGDNRVTGFSINQANLPKVATMNITGESPAYTISSKQPSLELPKEKLDTPINETEIYLLLPPCTLYDENHTNMNVIVTVDGIQRLVNIDLVKNKLNGELEPGCIYPINISFTPIPPTIEPEANCYIMKPGTTIYIPISQAKKGNPEKFKLAQRLFDTQILWLDGPSNMDIGVYNDQCIKVKSDSQMGNALICLKNKAGDILWSWHIWVTDYNPDFSIKNGDVYESNNGLLWMDRHLGATKVADGYNSMSTCEGLMYQWGRKDPYPGWIDSEHLKKFNNYVEPNNKEGATLKPHPASDQLKYAQIDNGIITQEYATAYSITNPQVLLVNWLGSVGSTVIDNINSWETPNGQKTIYDPCPAGWQVPVYVNGNQPWQEYLLIAQILGPNKCVMLHNDGVMGGYYPISGVIKPDSSRGYFEEQGYGWTSKCIDDEKTAFRLYIKEGRYINSQEEIKHNAMPIRCVKRK